MTQSAAQPDLFDLPVRPETRGGVPQLSSPRHWLVVNTTRARTACGIGVTDYRFKDRLGIAIEDSREVLCTHDGFDGTVTCARCLEVRG